MRMQPSAGLAQPAAVTATHMTCVDAACNMRPLFNSRHEHTSARCGCCMDMRPLFNSRHGHARDRCRCCMQHEASLQWQQRTMGVVVWSSSQSRLPRSLPSSLLRSTSSCLPTHAGAFTPAEQQHQPNPLSMAT